MAEVRIEERALRTAADSFTAKGQTLADRVESIISTQESLTAAWTGDAADAYVAYQGSWNDSAAAIAESFNSIGTALTTIADNFRSTEDTAVEVWPA